MENDNLIKNLSQSEIDRESLSSVVERLSSNMKNKFFFNPEPYKIHNSVSIFESYQGKNLRQSYYNNCQFSDADLGNAGLAGSLFFNCSFYPCDFYDTNLQSCDFRNCSFNNVKFKYTRMNKSIFHKTIFTNCDFTSVSINDAVFDSCQFVDCFWTVSIENTLFRDTYFDNVVFKSMNFEFAIFENIKANKVKFPFPTIPFIYNGLTYLSSTKDNIRITSAQKKEGLTVDEYLQYIDDLELFYKATQNYFPLANIYISQHKHEEAFNAICAGVRIAIQTRAFRMIRYYCKQIKYITNIIIQQKQALYYFILNELSICDLQEFEKRSFELYLPEIKEILYTQEGNERIKIMIDTNISENEYQKISTIMLVFDGFLKNKCTYSIEFSHNSPFKAVIDILSNPENVGLIISGFSLISSITFGTITAIQSHKKKLTKKEENECKEQSQLLANNNIAISNIYIINNGNIYMANQSSSQGNKYLNK